MHGTPRHHRLLFVLAADLISTVLALQAVDGGEPGTENQGHSRGPAGQIRSRTRGQAEWRALRYHRGLPRCDRI